MQLTENCARQAAHAPFDFARFLTSHRGGVSPEEGMALARHAAAVGHGDIVEIGSFRGKSAVALAHGLHHDPAASGRIVCVEPHADFTGVYGGIFGAEDRGAFYRIMLESGYFDRVALINLASEAAARAWSGPIGLLFIDGDHTHAGVQKDIECWEPFVEPGGCIAFDDSTDPAIGPAHVVEELLACRRFEFIERVGKITFLRKLAATLAPVHEQTAEQLRVLVVCHDLIASGGLLRFERVARELRTWGHELCFATLAAHSEPAWHSECPVLHIEEAARQQWSATMVPGAGFPEDTIRRFALLQADNFGYRVQHVLNDPSLKARFLAVNGSFRPDLVVFNNAHWAPGSYTEFQARKFTVLEGAVDTGRFAPAPYRTPPSARGKVVLGGLANKNPAPLIAALRRLPEHFTACLFGSFTGNEADIEDLVRSGRLELAGQVTEAALPGFYSRVDIVVHTEEFAGWANLAAEAMASGVPLVCTTHGTSAFARHGDTALVLDSASADSIADAVTVLCADPDATAAMVGRAREQICRYDWTHYAGRLAALCRDDGKFHYTLAPDLGLYGKWPLAERFKDLEYVFAHCRDATVIDFGCAEGVMARRCLDQGARLVHGLEIDESRVHTAAGLCVPYPDAYFFIHADLDEWNEIREPASRVLLPRYDIVLYLGIQHHLARPQRLATLADAVAMAGRIFAIRTTADVYRQDGIDALLAASGFRELTFGKQAQRDGFGLARIFLRR